jgi:'Cold-shock' DNA-binding domain
MNMMKAQQ